jgi:hypothetical protein
VKNGEAVTRNALTRRSAADRKLHGCFGRDKTSRGRNQLDLTLDQIIGQHIESIEFALCKTEGDTDIAAFNIS